MIRTGQHLGAGIPALKIPRLAASVGFVGGGSLTYPLNPLLRVGWFGKDPEGEFRLPRNKVSGASDRKQLAQGGAPERTLKVV